MYARMRLLSICSLLLILAGCGTPDNITKLKQMFSQMVEEKNAGVIPVFYHPDFVLYSNGSTMNYQQLVDFHKELYQTPIQYTVAYDDNTFLQSDDYVAGRVFIVVSRPDQEPKEIEVMLIARYKDGKIYRAWELTWPDWSQMPAFESVSK